MPFVFTDLATTKYHTQGHPEAPWRVSRTAERLLAAGLPPQAPGVKATDEDVLLVHTKKHLESVRKGTYSDADTPHYPGIADIALLGLSGALAAADSAKRGDPAFSLMRPPGHHAAPQRVAGFCYFNNIAIACQKSGARVAVIDVDVHHGDGTEAWALEREKVTFCSLHQTPLYPGTGLESRGNCLNFPLDPGTTEKPYLETLERAVSRALESRPELLAVSAGFDTYKECPLAGLKLDKDTYHRIGRMLAETRLPRFAVLEGGYTEDLPVLVERFLDGFFT